MPDPAPSIETVRDLRRHQIVDAARRIVGSEGLDALTFGRLEQTLSFTRGVITYHFRNKEEIVHALLDDALDEIYRGVVDEVQATDAPVDAVAAVIGGMVRGFLEKRDAAFVLLSFWGRLQSDPAVADKNAELYRGYRQSAAALVRRGQQEGALSAAIDPDAAAAVMVGLVIGIAGQALFEPDAIDVDGAVALSAEVMRAGLRQ